MELLRGDGRVLRIGHRGVEDGADAVELDVIGGLLVAHSRGEANGAPTLDDELERLAARGLAVQIDVKEPGLAAGVAAALASHGLRERSFVSTPSTSVLREFSAIAPALPRSLSYPADRLGLSSRAAAAPIVRFALAAGRLALPARLPQLLRSSGASAATLDHRVVSKRAVEACHRLRIAVIVWTVNEPALARSLVERGVDAIITDDPRIVPAGIPTFVKRLALLLLALLAAGALAASVLADTTPPPSTTDATTTAPAPSTVPLGVTLAGVQIGGLTPDAAAQAVTAAFNQPVTMRFGATRIAVAPSLLGLDVPVDSAVAKALTVAPNTQLALRGTVDSSLVRAFVAKIGARFARKPVSSKLVLRNLRPYVTPSVTGQTIEVNLGVRDLTNELVHGTRAPILLKARYKQPPVTPSTIGPVIVIRRGDNKLTLYNGMKLVRTFSVATGQAVYPTPLGKFSIVVMWRNPWWYPPNSPWAAGEKPIPPGPGNPLGTRWMGLSAPGVGIHGTPEDGSIGYSLSHGCIRMHIPQAEWLFNHVKVGTPVYIVAA